MTDSHSYPDTASATNALRDQIAERIWRAEAKRATGKDRSVDWAEVSDHDAHKYLYLAEAILPLIGVAQAPLSRWKHKKRGTTYELLGNAIIQTETPLSDMDPVLVYRCEEDGKIWVRPGSEFLDGRFEQLSALPSTQCAIAVCTCRPGPCAFPSTTLATLPGHDETMANLDALTISSTSRDSASTYCALCDHEHQLHEDAQGFHHVVKGARVVCPCPFPTEQK